MRALVLLVALLAAASVLAQETDTLIMNNGNRMACEVIRIDNDGYFVQVRGRKTTIPKNLVSDWVKRDESKYDATNGVSYAIGDTVMLGTGSGLNGKFVYLHSQALNVYLASETSNRGVVIKRILRRKMKGVEKVYFVVGAGNIVNYELDIEGAIATCEIRDCSKNDQATTIIQQAKQDDKYDKLKKLKELLDAGVLTQDEFDAEKKKILEGN